MRTLWNNLLQAIRLGSNRRTFLSLKNVTDAARTQAPITELERYRTVARNLPNTVVMLVDRTMRIVLVEGEFLSKTWYTKEAIQGKLVDEVFPSGVGESVVSNLKAAMQGEHRARQHEFADYVLLLHYLPIRDDRGDVTSVLVVAQDTTELRDTDTALRESEARYRLIADNSTDLISVQLVNGTITYVSPASEALLGYRPAELIGHSIFELVHPDDLEPRDWLPPQQLANPAPFSATARMRCKDGSYRWLETTYKIARNEQTKEPQHIIGSSRDISERMEAQLALQRSEEQLRSLITSMDDLVFSIDLNGCFLVYHQLKTSFYDTPINYDIFIGKHYTEVLPPELTEQLQDVIQVVTSTYDTRQLEYSLQIDDKVHYFSARVTPMISPRIELLGVTFVARDVTDAVETRLRQQRLMKLEQLHLAIAANFLENSNFDVALDDTLREVATFLDISRAYIFQIRENERLADNTHEWCAPGVASQQEHLQGLALHDLAPSLLPLLANEGIIDPEHIAELPEDVRVLLESQDIKSVLMLPFYVRERMQGFVAFDETRHSRRWLPEEIATIRTIAESLTRALERQQTELELIEARDTALRSARLKSEFMSNMSHEIRTPMTGVIGMLELLRESTLNEDQTEFVEIAHTSARRLMRLLDDILDFSKIEAGKVSLENIPIDLRGILSEVQTNFAIQAEKKQIKLQSDVEPEVPGRVLGDPTRLRQVLTNLVSNALKFTESGRILITLRQVSSAQGRSRLRFEILDSGIGIPEQQLENIFNSFVQADSSMTRRYGGTGLGLAICQQLVSLMGGSIDVESAVGVGSTFGFTLTMPIVSLNERLPANSMLSQVQALIIDEESTARYVLAQQLRRWGLSVIETLNLEMAEAFLLTTAKRSEEVNVVFVRSRSNQQEQWIDTIRDKLDYLAPRFILIADAEQDTVPVYDGTLQRPIRLSELYNVVIRSASLESLDLTPPEGDGFITMPQAGRILLAEDDAMNWKIVVRALSQLGYVVDVAHDGLEAIALVRQHDYAMILMDVHMPQMDGLEATRRIRALNSAKAKIPIVALTASVLNEEQEIYFDAGMNDFLGKPFSVEQLRATVQQWTSSSLRSHI